MSTKKPIARPVAETKSMGVALPPTHRPTQHSDDHRTTAHPAPARKLRLPAYVRHA